MEFISITKFEISKSTDKMKIDKSPGPDEIYPRILKEGKESVATPLEIIFRKSLEKGEVPEQWRQANVRLHSTLFCVYTLL